MEEEGQEPVGSEWMVTFADMLALLLTFFVMLVATSDIKPDGPLKSVLESLQHQFGKQSPSESNAIPSTASANPRKQVISDAQSDKGELPPTIPVSPRTRGYLGAVLTFSPGETTIGEEHKATLADLAATVAGKPHKIELRGHASTPAAEHTSWDVAYARSRAVLAALDRLGVDPGRIRISVSAEYEPPGLRDYPLGPMGPDRVEAFLLDELPSAKERAR